MSTTASKTVLKKYWEAAAARSELAVSDFEFRRYGYKDYAVFLKKFTSLMWARYDCSHTEAKRRWALKLITDRLTK